MYGIALVLVLTLSGGVIAYIGDKIGMKVGRKKLSLFGLRPKYTSIIITILTGILIAGSSLAVLTIVSSDVRTALFHMKEIQTALATSEIRYQASQERLKEVEDALAEQEQRAAYLTEQILLKEQEFAVLNQQLVEVVEQRDAAQLELDLARQEIAEVEAKYAEMELQYEQITADYDRLRSAYKEVEAAYDEIESRYQEALARYEATQQHLAQTQADLEKTTEALEIEKQRLEDMKEINRLFQARVEELKRTEEQMRQHMQILTQEYDELVARQNELIRLAQQELQIKQSELERIKSGNFVYQANEIMLATVIDGGKPRDELRNIIISFLNRTNEVALKRGKFGENSSKAVLIIDSDHLEEVIGFLAENEGKFVVRALAASNTLVGEPIEVRLVCLPNTLIYRKGDIILTRDIDLTYQTNIEDEIAQMLSDISDIGIARGMITYEDGTLGTALPGDEFIATLREVRKYQGRVQIVAVAAHNIWTGIGPMTIELHVRPLNSRTE